jgi:hypothetical protein
LIDDVEKYRLIGQEQLVDIIDVIGWWPGKLTAVQHPLHSLPVNTTLATNKSLDGRRLAGEQRIVPSV